MEALGARLPGASGRLRLRIAMMTMSPTPRDSGWNPTTVVVVEEREAMPLLR